MSSEKWLNDYKTIERLVQTISQNLSERSKYPKTSSNYGKISLSVRSEDGCKDRQPFLQINLNLNRYFTKLPI